MFARRISQEEAEKIVHMPTASHAALLTVRGNSATVSLANGRYLILEDCTENPELHTILSGGSLSYKTSKEKVSREYVMLAVDTKADNMLVAMVPYFIDGERKEGAYRLLSKEVAGKIFESTRARVQEAVRTGNIETVPVRRFMLPSVFLLPDEIAKTTRARAPSDGAAALGRSSAAAARAGAADPAMDAENYILWERMEEARIQSIADAREECIASCAPGELAVGPMRGRIPAEHASLCLARMEFDSSAHGCESALAQCIDLTNRVVAKLPPTYKTLGIVPGAKILAGESAVADSTPPDMSRKSAKRGDADASAPDPKRAAAAAAIAPAHADENGVLGVKDFVAQASVKMPSLTAGLLSDEFANIVNPSGAGIAKAPPMLASALYTARTFLNPEKSEVLRGKFKTAADWIARGADAFDAGTIDALKKMSMYEFMLENVSCTAPSVKTTDLVPVMIAQWIAGFVQAGFGKKRTEELETVATEIMMPCSLAMKAFRAAKEADAAAAKTRIEELEAELEAAKNAIKELEAQNAELKDKLTTVPAPDKVDLNAPTSGADWD